MAFWNAFGGAFGLGGGSPSGDGAATRQIGTTPQPMPGGMTLSGSLGAGGGASLGSLGQPKPLAPGFGTATQGGGYVAPGTFQRPAPPGPQNVPQGPSGVTRRGSQMVDAQGNVIGHYGDQNQAIYNAGQGPQPIPGGGDPNRTPQLPPWMKGPSQRPAPPQQQPDGSWMWNGQPFDPQNPPPFYRPSVDAGGYIPTDAQRAGEGNPIASGSMGMAPSWQRMAMPGGQIQDVPSAYAPNYLQQGGSLTGESTQYPAYSLSNVGRSGYRY